MNILGYFEIHTVDVYYSVTLEKMERNIMYHRINITLPEETLGIIDRVVEKGDRSRFIDKAVRYYVEAIGKAKLKKLLKEGAIARAERDLRIAEEWFTLEEESWQKGQK